MSDHRWALLIGPALLLAYAVSGLAGVLIVSIILVLVHAVLSRTALMTLRPRHVVDRAKPLQDGWAKALAGVDNEIPTSAHRLREFDHSLRPRLERAMSFRLLSNHAINCHRDPERAKRAVGATVWRWLDPRRPVEQSRTLPGPSQAEIREIVDRLEAL
jgi:hypothetical protein